MKKSNTMHKLECDLQEYENFLAPDQCEWYIQLATQTGAAKQGLAVNEKTGEVFQSDWRICKQVDIDVYHERICAGLRQRIADLLDVDVRRLEPMQVLIYKKGGEYKWHYDSFDFHGQGIAHLSMNDRPHHHMSSDRTHSAMIYLTDTFEGGGTAFTKPGANESEASDGLTPLVTVKPKQGKLITWRNLHPDGSRITDSCHAGLPVTKGVKWIIITWIREKDAVEYWDRHTDATIK